MSCASCDAVRAALSSSASAYRGGGGASEKQAKVGRQHNAAGTNWLDTDLPPGRLRGMPRVGRVGQGPCGRRMGASTCSTQTWVDRHLQGLHMAAHSYRVGHPQPVLGVRRVGRQPPQPLHLAAQLRRPRVRGGGRGGGGPGALSRCGSAGIGGSPGLCCPELLGARRRRLVFTAGFFGLEGAAGHDRGRSALSACPRARGRNESGGRGGYGVGGGQGRGREEWTWNPAAKQLWTVK